MNTEKPLFATVDRTTFLFPQPTMDALREELGSSSGVEEALDAHRVEEAPHKAYDIDIPDLAILFENGLL